MKSWSPDMPHDLMLLINSPQSKQHWSPAIVWNELLECCFIIHHLSASSQSPVRLVREFVAQNNSAQIRHVIQILATEFALSQHPHSRKGGLIGLAACSIALGKVCGLNVLTSSIDHWILYLMVYWLHCTRCSVWLNKANKYGGFAYISPIFCAI